MDKKATPIFDRVLLKPEKVTETIKGNIIIPVNVNDANPMGFAVVVSAGHKCEILKEHDRVLYPKGIGTEITMKDEAYVLMFEKDVLMID